MLRVKFLMELGNRKTVIFNTTDVYNVFRENQDTIYVAHRDTANDGNIYYTGFNKSDEGTVFEFV
jgi:hypothetical protein